MGCGFFKYEVVSEKELYQENVVSKLDKMYPGMVRTYGEEPLKMMREKLARQLVAMNLSFHGRESVSQRKIYQYATIKNTFVYLEPTIPWPYERLPSPDPYLEDEVPIFNLPIAYMKVYLLLDHELVQLTEYFLRMGYQGSATATDEYMEF